MGPSTRSGSWITINLDDGSSSDEVLPNERTDNSICPGGTASEAEKDVPNSSGEDDIPIIKYVYSDSFDASVLTAFP